jgi:hypothetical protein
VLVSTALSQPSKTMGKLIVYKDSESPNWQFGAWFPRLNSNFIASLDSSLEYKVLDCDIPEDKPNHYIEPETAFDDDDIPSKPELV